MTANASKPHIRLTIEFIRQYVPIIGPYGLTIYAVIKSHENGKSGACFPSYKTIARESGIDRGTVIRYVKKLKEFNLIDPEWRFKEDGSHDSNQYNFHGQEISRPSGGGAKKQQEVAPDNPPGSSSPPKLSETNKKKRTITDVDFYAEKSHIVTHRTDNTPTEKQKTCQHIEIASFDDITICYHCYRLLDESLTIQMEEKSPVEIVAAQI